MNDNPTSSSSSMQFVCDENTSGTECGCVEMKIFQFQLQISASFFALFIFGYFGICAFWTHTPTTICFESIWAWVNRDMRLHKQLKQNYWIDRIIRGSRKAKKKENGMASLLQIQKLELYSFVHATSFRWHEYGSDCISSSRQRRNDTLRTVCVCQLISDYYWICLSVRRLHFLALSLIRSHLGLFKIITLFW